MTFTFLFQFWPQKRDNISGASAHTLLLLLFLLIKSSFPLRHAWRMSAIKYKFEWQQQQQQQTAPRRYYSFN